VPVNAGSDVLINEGRIYKEVPCVVGLRDRALISVMTFAFAVSDAASAPCASL